LAVYHPEDEKAELLIFKNLLLKLWIIHIHIQFFHIKLAEAAGEGLNYMAG